MLWTLVHQGPQTPQFLKLIPFPLRHLAQNYENDIGFRKWENKTDKKSPPHPPVYFLLWENVETISS